MNEIVNRFLLAGDNFMPEIHLKQRGLIDNACSPFTKNKERIQKFMQTQITLIGIIIIQPMINIKT